MKKIFFLLLLLDMFGLNAQSIPLPRNEDVHVKGFVMDRELKTKMDATVWIIGETYYDTIYNKWTLADSGFVFTIPKENKNKYFQVWVMRHGFSTLRTGLLPDQAKKEILIYSIFRVTGGAKTVVFNSIHFDYDESLVNTHSKKLLDSAVTYLKKYPEVHIEIEGYTDNTGTDDYNLPLSQQRADEVKDYLVSKGIELKRILRTIGSGSSKPVDSNDTEDGKAKNRRVEIRLVM
jgi:outer membrane protein OmpA-like peptidoglycan-associated protein